MWNSGTFVLFIVLLIQPGFQIDDFYDEEFQPSDAVVRKFWGIQDVTISVGKLLYCKIPPDAFKGHIVSYDVKGDEEKSLPKWIIFDKEASVLKGVPMEDDTGDIRVNVKAFDNQGHFVSDIFVVEVYPLLEKNTDDKRKCKKGEDVNMIAIIIDKPINDFTPIQKIKAIQNLSAYLDIPVNTLLLLSAKFISDIETNAILGISRDLDLTSSNKSVLTWQIGCNDKIWAEKLRDVKLVKKYVKDGVLEKVLQLPLVESRLVSNSNPFRLRRYIYTNETGKSDQKDSIDDESDSEDGDPEDEEDGDGGSDLPSDFDIDPPIPPEFSSSKLSQNFQQSPVSTKTVTETENFYEPTRKSVFPLKDKNDEDESTEIPEEADLLTPNSSIFGRNPTPELPSTALQLNTTTISVIPLPENATIKSKRYPPLILNNLDPITAVAGKLYNLSIPSDIFHDEQDGNMTNLILKLKNLDENQSCPPWIEFNAEKREILLLPRTDSVSNYDFVLEAVNSDGMDANITFTVAVQYPPTTQRVNFEISLHMKHADNQNLNVTFQLELLDRLAKLYGNVNTDNITVRSVSCNPFVLTWTNSSLSLDTCDSATILNLLNVLTDSELSPNINEVVRQEFSSLVNVEKITWKGIGLCENVLTPRLPKPPKQNFNPVVNARVDNITARVGELTVFVIPDGVFYDPDVPVSDLKINVLTIDHSPIPADNWLQYDAKNRELYGLPMNNDVGSSKYQMECVDDTNVGENWVARQVIDVVVEPALEIRYNIEFSLTLKMPFEVVSKSPYLRRSFVEKLASLFNRNSSSIVISNYTPGSVIVTWHNKSLPIDRCPETDMEQLRKVLLDDEGKLNENVNKVLSSDFEVKDAQVRPIGICEGGLTEFHPTEVNVPSQEIHAILFSPSTLTSYIKEYFFEIVFPILIILAMLLLAGIIACVLYRRQRRAKWTLGDDDDRRTYRNKGIPVIFQDELEERLEPTNKSPIIMKEEKPPLPPPEYQRTLPMATTALLSDFDDPSYQQGSVTFTSQTDRNGRSKATPIYRKPPPYVPP